MNKTEVLEYLKRHDIPYESVEHPAVYTSAQAKALHLPHPEAEAKNLFLRDDKKRNYYLVTLREGITAGLKEVQEKLGSRRLSFASEDDLRDLLGLHKGSVTPLGLLNDTEHRVQFFLDSYFAKRLIGVHPNENTATVYLATEDMLTLLAENGAPPVLIDFSS